MVGSDQIYRPSRLGDEPLVEAASVQKFRDRATDFALRFLPHQTREWKPAELKKQNLSTKERSSTELRFASFLAPLWGFGRAVKVRDERPTGALDSSPEPERRCVSNFLLDKADDFIDGSSRRRTRRWRAQAGSDTGPQYLPASRRTPDRC